MFGYRELIFPIFFEEKIVAVFVVGQIKIVGENQKIKDNKINFFNQHSNIFDDYIKDLKNLIHSKDNTDEYTSESIIEYIINNSNRGTKTKYPEIYTMKQGLQIPIIEDQFNIDQYEEMVRKICNWLDKLEKQLAVEIKRKREAYVRSILSNELSKYFIASSNVDYAFSIRETLWVPVKKIIEKISEECLLEYMIVFSVRSINKKVINNLEVVAFSTKNITHLLPIYFSLNVPSVDYLMNKPSASNVEPDLFDALSISFKDYESMSVIFHPMKGIPAASVAILIKYKSKTLKNSIENVLIAGLQTLLALISSHLAMCFENAAQIQIKKILRLYKHEMTNLSSDLSRGINYLGFPDLNEIDSQKRNDVYHDALGSLAMFDFISKNIGIIVNDPILPEKKDVRIYHDLLYKWENIKRVDARDKGCDIEFKKSHITIFTDPRYAEIIVYNLLTNAVKYAYDDSMIYIHCAKQVTQNNFVLSVTNFTFNIKESQRMKLFEYGYRTQNARSYYPEGSGIGLWLVREVIERLGGNVMLCKPQWISDYNIPLLHEYINRSNIYAVDNIETFQEANNEYNRLLNEYIINDFGERQNKISWIISKHNWCTPVKSKVNTELFKETYMIRFEVIFYA
jgi:hypothetical protein